MRTRRTAPRCRRRGGFTLMEVLLVLAILVILGSLVAMSFSNVLGDSDRKAAQSQVNLFETPIQLYFFHTKMYPSSLEALRSPPADLPNPAKWQGPYLEKPVPADPWERPYQYAAPGKYNVDTFDVWSSGPNGVDGDDDDIGNWVR